MKRFSKILVFVPVILLACISEIDMNLASDEPKLVADVLISSAPGASSVKIGWTFPAGSPCHFDSPFGSKPSPCDDNQSTGPYAVTGFVRITEKESGNMFEFPLNMRERRGFIKIDPGIVGTVGHTYSLEIEISYNNETQYYQSETYMRQTPAIQNMSYEIRKGDVGKEDNFVPLIFFTEPQNEKNFYLFQLCEVYQGSAEEYCNNSNVWGYSIISDDFLPEDVRGLSIDDGATTIKYAEFYPAVYPGVGAVVRMYSVDRETYEFYRSLLGQFGSDGGAHSPAPASPKSNITGNLIGLFRAIHESSGKVYLQ